jgi:PAS domain S-box-containing protein
MGSRRTLQWAISGYSVSVGAAMLVVPHRFSAPTFALLQPDLLLWGIVFLLVGIYLFALAAITPQHKISIAVGHILGGGLLLLLAFGFAAAQTWTGTINYGVLGIGMFLPLLKPNAPSNSERDLFVLLMGLGAALTGLSIVLLPEQFSSSSYDLVRHVLPQFGIAMALSGMFLVFTQVHTNIPRILVYLSHLSIGIVYILWIGVLNPFLARAWAPFAIYGGLGTATALLPWIKYRLRDVDLSSLRIQLAIGLVSTTALILIIVVALVTDQEERIATERSSAFLQSLTGTLAQYAEDYMQLHRDVLNTLAAFPRLMQLSQVDQQAVLRTFSQNHATVYVFGIYDLQGNVVVRSDGVSLGIGDLELFQTARTGNQPSLQILKGRTTQIPIIVLGSPVRDEEGNFVGLVTLSIEASKLGALLQQAAANTDINVYMVDGHGHIITHNDFHLVEAFADFSTADPVARFLQRQTSSGALQYGTPRNRQFAAYTLVTDLGWGVIVEQPAASILAGVRNGREAAFAILLLMTGVVALLGVWVATSLAYPLNSLTWAVNQLSSGKQGGVLPRSRIIEIRQLSVAFDHLRNDLALRTRQRDDAEQLLRSEREQLKTTLNSIIDAVIATDADGCITFINPVAELIINWQSTDVVGKNIKEVFHLVDEDTRQPIENPVDKVLRDGTPIGLSNHRTLISHTGREYPIDDSAAPIRDEEGYIRGAVLVFRDISVRRQIEHERQRLLLSEQAARAQAEMAIRLRDEFLSVAAHDPNQLQRALQTVNKQSIKLETLCNQLLDVSRIEAGRLALNREPVDLTYLTYAAVEAVQQDDPHHRISVNAPPQLIASVDSIRIEQVLINLLNNAAKFSPVDSPIVVELAILTSSTVKISVTDRGIGIPPERRSNLFQRFYQAHTEGYMGGMGLGLYISNQIVTLHDGEIHPEFPPEGGTRFIITLPVNLQ